MPGDSCEPGQPWANWDVWAPPTEMGTLVPSPAVSLSVWLYLRRLSRHREHLAELEAWQGLP